jgi:hypothetical protein
MCILQKLLLGAAVCNSSRASGLPDSVISLTLRRRFGAAAPAFSLLARRQVSSHP